MTSTACPAAKVRSPAAIMRHVPRMGLSASNRAALRTAHRAARTRNDSLLRLPT